MAGETVITVIGNLTADPELRFTSSGAAVASFTIASTPRTYDRDSGQWKDGEALFMRCSAWREMAENVAESCTKGMRVIAQGRLQQRSYETQQGEKRTVVELQVDDIGPSLRYSTARVERNPRNSNGGGFGGNPNGGGNWGNQGGQGGQGRNAGGNAGGNMAPGRGGQGNYGNQRSGGYNNGPQGGNGGGNWGNSSNADDPWGANAPLDEPSSLDQDPPF